MTKPRLEPICVDLRDTVTGRVHHFETEGAFDEDGFRAYWWEDGNAGCDCNRSAFMGGPALDCNVGPNRIVIDRIVRLATGEVVYAEWPL